jgi:hypothetical protein
MPFRSAERSTDQTTACVDARAFVWPSICFRSAGIRTPYLPLNALRAFEASARHLSFTKAGMVSLLKSPQGRERLEIFAGRPYRHGHGDDSLRCPCSKFRIAEKT